MPEYMILASFRRTRSTFIRTLSYSMPPRRKASVLADDDERPQKKAKNDDIELEPKAKKPRGASGRILSALCYRNSG